MIDLAWKWLEPRNPRSMYEDFIPKNFYLSRELRPWQFVNSKQLKQEDIITVEEAVEHADYIAQQQIRNYKRAMDEVNKNAKSKQDMITDEDVGEITGIKKQSTSGAWKHLPIFRSFDDDPPLGALNRFKFTAAIKK